MSKSPRITIRIPQELLDALDSATSKEQSPSDVVREAIYRELRRRKIPVEKPVVEMGRPTER